MGHAQPGHHPELPLDEVSVAAQVFEQGRVPGAAVFVGSLGRGVAEEVHVRHDAFHRPAEIPAKGCVGYHGERAAQARHVEGLAGRHQRDGAGRDPVAQGGEGDMPLVLVQHQPRVNLVRSDDKVVAHGQFGQHP